MSSIPILSLIQTSLIRYGTLVILIFGFVGNIGVVYLFSHHHKNGCALYLLCAALFNIIYLSVSIPYGLYVLDNFDPSSSSLYV
ncbi:unnamed protein product, partial [Adineta ricciae]